MGNPEWLALHTGGLKMDIAFAPVQPGDQDLAQMLASFAHQDVLERGVRLLFYKTCSAAPTGISPPTPPRQAHIPSSSAAFRPRISHFWIIAAKTAKLILRNDLWRAKQSCDGESKTCPLTMGEWHARATYGLERDIWYDGRFLSNWADPSTLSELPVTFAAYDQAHLRRPFLATIQRYHPLAGETANRLGLDYPQPNHLQVVDWINASLASQLAKPRLIAPYARSVIG